MNPFLRLLSENRGRVARDKAFRVVRASAGAQEAHVYVYDVIVDSDIEAEWFGGVSKQAFTQAIAAIDAPQIRLHIDSPGGSVFAARTMASALRDHAARVVCQIDGLAASAASVLAMAADEVLMAEGTMMMIHKAWTFAAGNADDLLATAALLEKVDGTIADTYAQRTGMDAAAVLDLMAAETWMTAEEAIAAKFADGLTQPAAADPAARAAWNLSAFAHAPAYACAAAPAHPAAPAAAAAQPNPDDARIVRARQSQRTRVAELAYLQPV